MNGSGHPSAPTPYVRNLENVFVPNVVKRVAAETEHKVKFIEAYGGKIAKVYETFEAVEKGLLDQVRTVYALKQRNFYH